MVYNYVLQNIILFKNWFTKTGKKVHFQTMYCYNKVSKTFITYYYKHLCTRRPCTEWYAIAVYPVFGAVQPCWPGQPARTAAWEEWQQNRRPELSPQSSQYTASLVCKHASHYLIPGDHYAIRSQFELKPRINLNLLVIFWHKSFSPIRPSVVCLPYKCGPTWLRRWRPSVRAHQVWSSSPGLPGPPSTGAGCPRAGNLTCMTTKMCGEG